MKTCLKCTKSSTVDLGYTSYCDAHFMQVIIKRVRKHMIGVFNFKKTYYVIEGENTEDAMKLLENIYGGELKTKKAKRSSKNTVSTLLLEDVVDDFLQSFLLNTNYRLPKGIHPFIVILRKEFAEIARILKVKWKVKKSLLDEIEKDHPGTKFATLKSLKYFEENHK